MPRRLRPDGERQVRPGGIAAQRGAPPRPAGPNCRRARPRSAGAGAGTALGGQSIVDPEHGTADAAREQTHDAVVGVEAAHDPAAAMQIDQERQGASRAKAGRGPTVWRGPPASTVRSLTSANGTPARSRTRARSRRAGVQRRFARKAAGGASAVPPGAGGKRARHIGVEQRTHVRLHAAASVVTRARSISSSQPGRSSGTEPGASPCTDDAAG